MARGFRRSAASAVALALAIPLGLAAVGATGAPARAEVPPEAPRVRLSVPADQTAYSSGRVVYTDLGMRMIAENGDLELHLDRADYDSGVTVARKEADGSLTAFGDELTESLGGLQDLITLRFRPLGKRARPAFTRRVDACLGSITERIDPDADPRSRYPRYCNYNPYALGAVQGITEGYAASVTDPWGTGIRRVPAGRYQVTVSVDEAWAEVLRMAPDDRVATTTLRVETYDDCEVGRGCRRSDDSGGRVHVPEQAPRRAAAGAVDADALPEDTPKPDLRALPAWGIQISRNGNFLQFSATVWNGGTSPLVVDGFRRAGQDVMDGYQYFFDADGEQLPDYVPVGEFEWDPKPTHLHWHFRSFAAYSLLPPGHTPEAPDGHDHGVDSRKEAFCLANTDAVDLSAPGAQWNVDNSDLSTACGGYESLSIREVLAAGWGDTYAQFRAGQSFDLRGLANGCYDIWVEGNPIVDHESGARTLIESDYSNNTAKREVCIGGRPGARTIRSIEQIGVIDEAAMGWGLRSR